MLRNRHISLLRNLLLMSRSSSGGLRPILLPDERAEINHLIKDHTPHLVNIIHELELEVKGGGTGGLVGGVVPDLQVGVLEGVFARDSGGGVEGEHAVEEVQGVWVGVREEALEGDLGHVGEVADVFLGAWGADALEGCFVGAAEVVQDLVELVDVVAAFEEGAAAQEFG